MSNNILILKTEIQVQNLKCTRCARIIEKKMNSIEGIEKVEVVVSKATVSFNYQNDEQLGIVKQSLFKVGYPSLDTENTTSSKVKSYVSCLIRKTKQ